MNEENLKNKHCMYNNFKRARYFHGMLMTERDFTEEQKYHNEKRKMLNRMLHGWGVVCGLEIKPTKPASSTIIIRPGLVLDCNGNEICVTEEYPLKIDKIIKSDPSPKVQAAECAEPENGEEEQKWYITIRYEEKTSDPVAVYAPAGGCEEKACEYSRTREGYCFELRKEINPKCCPAPRRKPEDEDNPCRKYEKIDPDYEKNVRELLCERFLMPCPGDCCDDKYVVLGSVIIKPKSNSDAQFEPIESEKINNWDCRRYVMSFGLLQHWMTLLAPLKLPFEYIVDYARYAKGCEDPVEVFERYICPPPETPEQEAKVKKEALKEKQKRVK